MDRRRQRLDRLIADLNRDQAAMDAARQVPPPDEDETPEEEQTEDGDDTVTTTTSPGEPPREPSEEEIARGLAQLENLVQPEEPEQPETEDEPADDDREQPSATLDLYVNGETRRVQALRREVAEAHLLADLQEDDTPLLLDTDKVRKLRRRTLEAARLHELAHHPAALAYRDAKVRRVTTAMVMGSAGIALAVSSIGVQASVVKALDLTKEMIGWWAAFGVEPVLSLPLLAAVGVQAYSAIRGRVVDRKSREGRKLFWVELSLLALTLVLNCWPAFRIDFDLLDLIVHSLGPVAAVLAVWVLPTLWKILSDLPVPWLSTPPVQPPYRGNASGQYTAGTPSVQDLADRLQAMIVTGHLAPNPGVHKIRKTLKEQGIQVGSDKATEIQKLLAGGTS